MTSNYDWLRLDNSAKIYPMLMNKQNQNLFRLACEIKEEVDPEILQNALEITLTRFPSFSVRLMRGFFWYYFEQNTAKPVVIPEPDVIMSKITDKNCNGYNFRICYYRNRISIEFFHAICDGTGGMEFLKSLLYTYLNLKGADIESNCMVLTVGSPMSLRELEDSFITNYKPTKIKDLKINELTSKMAYKIKGIPFKDNGKGVIIATLNPEKLHAYCKSLGLTITEFLGGLFMYSIYKVKGCSKSDNELMQLFVPINLRKSFNSITLRNFSLFSRVGVDIHEPDIPLSVFTEAMKTHLKHDTEKELLANKICTTVKAEKLIIMRIMPLFIKQLIFNCFNRVFGKSKKSATFSNLGVIKFPESMRDYIDNFAFQLQATKDAPINMTIGTLFDKMRISFTRIFRDTEIETYFIRYLTGLGFDIKVESNLWEVDYAL